jgi:hypothetical protein
MTQFLQIAAWLASVVACMVLLAKAPRRGKAFVLKTAIGSIVGSMLFVTVLGLSLRHLGIRSSHAFMSTLFQLLFTVIIAAMLNIMNLVFQGMVDAQIAFHRRFNAANLHRFPVSFVIAHRERIKAFGALFWSFAGGMMLYGVWFHMQFSP